jgi:hypothetical protein
MNFFAFPWCRSQEHQFWVLNELFELLTPHGSYGAVHDSVVRAECHVHHTGNAVRIIAFSGSLVDKNSLGCSTHCQDACLRWVDDCGEVVDAEHAQVGNGESAARELFWLQFVIASASSDVLNLSCDLVKTLQIRVAEHWCHEAVVGLHSNAHVDVGELADEVIHPLGVGLWHFG